MSYSFDNVNIADTSEILKTISNGALSAIFMDNVIDKFRHKNFITYDNDICNVHPYTIGDNDIGLVILELHDIFFNVDAHWYNIINHFNLHCTLNQFTNGNRNHVFHWYNTWPYPTVEMNMSYITTNPKYLKLQHTCSGEHILYIQSIQYILSLIVFTEKLFHFPISFYAYSNLYTLKFEKENLIYDLINIVKNNPKIFANIKNYQIIEALRNYMLDANIPTMPLCNDMDLLPAIETLLNNRSGKFN